MDRLNEATHKLSAKLYEQASADAGAQTAGGEQGPMGGAAPGPEPQESTDDVVDAEFEVKDDDKKESTDA